MARDAGHVDVREATKSRSERKGWSFERPPDSGSEAERPGAASENAQGGPATWKTSEADVKGRATSSCGRRRLWNYGVALLLVAVATMLRWASGDVLSAAPTLVFYLAWVGAAAVGGLGPGLLATVASWLCIDFLFDSTPGQIGFSDPGSVDRLIVMLAGGLIISIVGEQMRRGRIRDRRQARRLADLAQSLAWEKETLQSVMNGAKNSHLVYLDRNFDFVRVNEAYARSCGYTPQEMIGKNHFALFPNAESEADFFPRARYGPARGGPRQAFRVSQPAGEGNHILGLDSHSRQERRRVCRGPCVLPV